MSTFHIPILMYNAESRPWTKAHVIRLKESEMRSLRNKKAKTRRENKCRKYHEEFKDINK
jgi:hypothetical protein